MCLIVLTPTQVVESVKRALVRANKKLAEAQGEVAEALGTIDHVVDSFREGRYKEEKPDYGITLTTTPVDVAVEKLGDKFQDYKVAEKEEDRKKCKCPNNCGCGHKKFAMDHLSDYL